MDFAFICVVYSRKSEIQTYLNVIFEFSVKSVFPSRMVKQTPTLFLARKSACSKNLCGFERVHLAEEDALPLAGIRQTAVGQYLMEGQQGRWMWVARVGG